jgi:hypothetical protein
MIGVLSKQIAPRSSHFWGEELDVEALDILKKTTNRIFILSIKKR